MAGEKKKVKNKQNFIPIKKTTVQHINYTQQISSPIYTTLDVKNMNRSIQLKKQATNKKSLSRKSGCISAKPICSSVKATCTTSTPTGIKYKQLLKKFDQLKGIQQRVQRSKSKSLKEIRQKQKSRSPKMKYNNSKKFNLTQLINKHPGTGSKIHYYTTTTTQHHHKTEFNSRMSLTNKLQKTLTRINQNQYFDKDSDTSLIPFISTSQQYNNQQSHTILNSRCFDISTNQLQPDDDIINMGEMRKFCRTMQNQDLFESSIKRDIGYFRGDRYEMMATRIQRAWRRYCTKRLVDRYADVYVGQFIKDKFNKNKNRESKKNRQKIEQNFRQQHEKKDHKNSSSSSQLKYYSQIDDINDRKYNNKMRNKRVHAVQQQYKYNNDQQKQQENSYDIICRVDHQLSSSSSSQQQQQENPNNRTYSPQQQQPQDSSNYQSPNKQQSQQQEYHQQQSPSNILSSSILYPESSRIQQQQRLVTYISNLDEEDLQDQHQQINNQHQLINLKTIEYREVDNNSEQQQQQFSQVQQWQYTDQNNYKQKDNKQTKLTQSKLNSLKNYQQQMNEKSQTQTDFIITQVKQQQLNKWNQVIHLLKQNKNKQSSQQQINIILSKLKQKSSNNKHQLQSTMIQQQSKLKQSKEQSKQSKQKQSKEQSKYQQNYNPSSISNHQMNKKIKKIQIQIKKQQHENITNNNKHQLLKQTNLPPAKRQSSGPSSQLSDRKKQQQFDSRKYIQYLDSDMYYDFDKDKHSQNSQPISRQDILNISSSRRISVKKQKLLLTILDVQQPPLIKRKVFGHSVSKSENLTYLTQKKYHYKQQQYNKYQQYDHQQQQGQYQEQDFHQSFHHPVITRHRLVKSMSEKHIQITIRSISPKLQYPQDDIQDKDDLNLQLIRQQFLQSGDTAIMQFQKLHTSNELRSMIKQTLGARGSNYQQRGIVVNNNIRDEYQFYEDEPKQPLVRVSIDLTKTFGLVNDNGDSHTEEQQQYESQQQSLQQQIKKHNKTNNQPLTKNNQSTAFQQLQLQAPTTINLQPSNITQQQLKSTIVIPIQQIDQSISSDDEEHDSLANIQIQTQKQKQDKIENLSFMIYNTMILEVLRQIASYDTVLEKFKDYSMSVKQAIKQGKKGFQTNHTEVKSYVDGLITHLLNEEPQVFKNLQVPAGPTALEMLHYMHPNDEDDMDQGSSVSQDQTSVLVIPNRIFDIFWNLRQKTLKFDIESAPHINPQRKKKIVEQLKNLTKMFYRSIFDTFNQCLDIERNFGQSGKPYPWKKTPMFQHTKTLPEIQKSIGNAQKRMSQIGTTYCGLIIQKNEMARITLQGSDDYIQHVQQDRMSRMLAQDLIEGEQRWTFYDDEQLQLLVQIGNFIVISLIIQATGQICQLSMKDK